MLFFINLIKNKILCLIRVNDILNYKSFYTLWNLKNICKIYLELLSKFLSIYLYYNKKYLLFSFDILLTSSYQRNNFNNKFQ